MAAAVWVFALLGCSGRFDETLPAHAAPAAAQTPRAAPRQSAAPPAPATPPKATTDGAAPPSTAPAVAPRTPNELVIFAGGDVNLGRECGQAILADPSYDPFAAVAPIWADADLRFANLESQLSDQGGETQSPRHRLIFTGPPGGADVLSKAGIHVVSTANNHAWDYGRGAMFETLANLRRAGVVPAGTGENLAEAYRPATFDVNGFKVALFAVTHIWNYGPIQEHEGRKHVAWARFDAFRTEFLRARREHDVVLISYHGGEEYIDAPVTRAREFVKVVMNAGADAVIGHHPHVPQGVGWVGGKPVFYSLGNFVFAGHANRPWTRAGFLAKLVFTRSKAGDGATDASLNVEAYACPYRLEGHLPKPLSGPENADEARAFHRHLRRISTATGGSELGEPDELGCFRISPPPKRSAPKPARVAAVVKR